MNEEPPQNFVETTHNEELDSSRTTDHALPTEPTCDTGYVSPDAPNFSAHFDRFETIKKFGWDSATQEGTNIFVLRASDALLVPNRRILLREYAYFKFKKIVFRMVVSEQAQMSGLLKWTYIPGRITYKDNEDRIFNYAHKTKSGLWWSVSQGGEIELEMPWVHAVSYVHDDPNQLYTSTVRDCGTWICKVASSLQVGQTSSNFLDIRVEARVEGIEVFWKKPYSSKGMTLQGLEEVRHFMTTDKFINGPQGAPLVKGHNSTPLQPHMNNGTEMDVDYLLTQEHLLSGYVTIPKASRAGTLIASYPVAPGLCIPQYTGDSTSEEYFGTQCLFRHLSTYWSGELIMHVRARMSESHNFTLLFVRTPTSKPDQGEDPTQYPHVKVEMGMKWEVKIHLPPMGSHFYKVGSNPRINHGPSMAHYGYVHIYLYTQVAYSMTNPTDVPLFISSCGAQMGSNPLSFYVPATKTISRVIARTEDLGESSTSKPETSTLQLGEDYYADEIVLGDKCFGAKAMSHLDTERITNVLQFMMKANVFQIKWDPGDVEDDKWHPIGIPVHPFYGAKDFPGNSASYFETMYQFWNGSLEYMVTADVNVIELIARPNWKNPVLSYGELFDSHFDNTVPFKGGKEPLMNIANNESFVMALVPDHPYFFIQYTGQPEQYAAADLLRFNKRLWINTYNSADFKRGRNVVVYMNAGPDFCLAGYKGVHFWNGAVADSKKPEIIKGEIEFKPTTRVIAEVPDYGQGIGMGHYTDMENKAYMDERIGHLSTTETPEESTTEDVPDYTMPSKRVRRALGLESAEEKFRNFLYLQNKVEDLEYPSSISPPEQEMSNMHLQSGKKKKSVFSFKKKSPTRRSRSQSRSPGTSTATILEGEADEDEGGGILTIGKNVNAVLSKIKKHNVIENLSASTTEIGSASRELKNTLRSVKSASEKINITIDRVEDDIDDVKARVCETLSSIESLAEEWSPDQFLSKILDTSLGEKAGILLLELIQVLTEPTKKNIGFFVSRLVFHFGLPKKLVSLIKDKVNFSSEQGEGMTLQASGDVAAGVLAAVVLALGFKISGGDTVDPKRVHSVFDFMSVKGRDFMNIRAGLDGMMTIHEKASNLVKDGLHFMFKDKIQLSMRDKEFAEHMDKVQTCIKTMVPNMEAEASVAIYGDRELLKTTYESYVFCKANVHNVRDMKLVHLWRTVAIAFEHIAKEFHVKSLDVPYRMDPIEFSIYGEPKIGKGDFAHLLIRTLLKSQNSDPQDVFCVNPSVTYWDNYDFNRAVFIDDRDQNEADIEFPMQMILMKSNIPMTLNMASLETKGRQFTSDLIVSTTNVAHPSPACISKKEAYQRRRDYLIEMVKKDGISMRDDYSHAFFRILESVGGKSPAVLKDNLSVTDILSFCVEKYSDHLKNQLFLKLRKFPDSTVPRVVNYNATTARNFSIREIQGQAEVDRSVIDQYLDYPMELQAGEDETEDEIDLTAHHSRVSTPPAFDELKDWNPNGTDKSRTVVLDTQLIDVPDHIDTIGVRAFRLTDNNGRMRVEAFKKVGTVFAWIPLKITTDLCHMLLKLFIVHEHALVGADPDLKRYFDRIHHEYFTDKITLGQCWDRMLVDAKQILLGGLALFCVPVDSEIAEVMQKAALRVGLIDEITAGDTEALIHPVCVLKDKYRCLLVDSLNTIQGYTNSRLAKINNPIIFHVELFANAMVSLAMALGTSIAWVLDKALSSVSTGIVLASNWLCRRMKENKWIVFAIMGISSGLLIYWWWKVSRKPYSLVNKLKDKATKKQNPTLKLEGEKVMAIIQDVHHKDLPEGKARSHVHMCTQCNNLFAHKHKKNPLEISMRFPQICRKCADKIGAVTEESVMEMEYDRHTTVKGKRKAKLKMVEGREIDIEITDDEEEDEEEILKPEVPCSIPKKELQGNTDENAVEMMRSSLVNNQCVLNVGNRSIGVLGLYGKVLLTCAHLIPRGGPKVRSGLLYKRGSPMISITIRDKDIYYWPDVKLASGRTATRDLMLIRLQEKSIPQFHKIVGKFATEQSMGSFVDRSGVLPVLNTENGSFSIRELQVPKLRVGSANVYNSARETYGHASTWSYCVNSQKGDCGTPLIGLNPAVGGGKIIGIHSAGSSTECAAQMVWKEMLEKHLSIFDPEWNTNPIQASAPNLDKMAMQCKYVEEMRHVPTSDVYTNVGFLKQPLYEPGTTEIVPTPIFDMYQAHVSEPTVLRRDDPRIQTGEDPKLKARDKFELAGGWPENMMDLAIDHTLEKLVNFARETPGVYRVLTTTEAINGVDGIVEPINMDTAAGYPYINDTRRPSGVGGKSWLFDVVETLPNGKRIYAPKPWFQNEIELAEKHLFKTGEALDCVWKDALKDERTKLKKVAEADTREFNVINTLWLIIVKKYYASLQTLVAALKERYHSSISVNMYGPDVTNMIRYMRQADHFFALDAKKYDATFDTLSMNACIEVAARYMYYACLMGGYTESDSREIERRTRLIGQSTHICRLHVNGQLAYMVNIGMPSGSYVTILFNTLRWILVAKVMWLILCDERKEELFLEHGRHLDLDDWEECTRNVFTGDDCFCGVSDEMKEIWNAINIQRVGARFGFKLVSASKDERKLEKFEEFSEIVYLKCNFVEDEAFPNYWKAKMNIINPVGELTNWMRCTNPTDEAMHSNAGDFARFLYAHGEDVFQQETRKLNALLIQKGLPLNLLSYQQLRREWCDAHDLPQDV